MPPPQIDHSNAARSANDDYGACDGLNKDQGYDQSQDRRRRSQDSATATPMDYDNNDLLDLDANLKPQLKLHNGRLDLDETKHPDYYTLYKDTTLYNLRGVIRSLTVVGASSTAAVYLLLLTYKLAEDLYIFVSIKAVLTLLHLNWFVVAMWPWRLLLWTASGA
ncbi:hypothetical protein BKA57DRAFT_445110 [Linnemannia elongata]|nr:hypothetical protein BKA57DRAFT_445110 [Linnemannia elongata]